MILNEFADGNYTDVHDNGTRKEITCHTNGDLIFSLETRYFTMALDPKARGINLGFDISDQ